MSELQTAITNLQLKHSELVAAVKSYPGSVAGTVNDTMEPARGVVRDIKTTVGALRAQIDDRGYTLFLDWVYDSAVLLGEGKPLAGQWSGGSVTEGGLNVEGGAASIPLGPWYRETDGTFVVRGDFNKAQVFGEEVTGTGSLVMTYRGGVANLYFSSSSISGGTPISDTLELTSEELSQVELIEFFPWYSEPAAAAHLAYSPALRFSEQSFVMVK